MTIGFKREQRHENFGAFCPTLGCEMKSSFRASEARPGIQDFQAILDSGFRRNDGLSDFCKNLICYRAF